MYTSWKSFPAPAKAVPPVVLVISDGSSYELFWKGGFEEAAKANENVCSIVFRKSVVEGIEYGRREIIFAAIDNADGYSHLKQACLLGQLTSVPVIALSARDIERTELLKLESLGVTGLVCLAHIPTHTKPSTGAIHASTDVFPMFLKTINDLIDMCVAPITVESLLAHNQLVIPINITVLKSKINGHSGGDRKTAA